jgi:hypothetical protein
VNGPEIAAAGETSATGTAVVAGDGRVVPSAGEVGLCVTIGAAAELVTGAGLSLAPGDAAGLAVPPGVVATGVGFGVGDGVGCAVGVGVDVAHVPAGDTGGGSAPARGSYRKPASSLSLNVAIDTPCDELVHAPPPREMKNTQ